jgi:hypothetical protein
MRQFLFISRIMNDVCAHNPYIVQHMDPMNNLEEASHLQYTWMAQM